MRALLALILAAHITGTSGEPKPPRAVQIEDKYGLTFDSVQTGDGQKWWLFYAKNPNLIFGAYPVVTSVNAKDPEVAAAAETGATCAKFYTLEIQSLINKYKEEHPDTAPKGGMWIYE